MNLFSKTWLRMFRSKPTEDETMAVPEQAPAAAPAAPAAPGFFAAAAAEHAVANADLAAMQAASAVAAADVSSLSVQINPSVADVAALKAALAADDGSGRLSVVEAAPAAPDAEAAKFVGAPLQTDTLRDLLKALGHDIGDVWDDVVKLAKKAI